MGSKTGGKQAICLSSATALPEAEIAWRALLAATKKYGCAVS